MKRLRGNRHPNLIAFCAFILTPSYALVHMDYHPSLISVSIPESRAKVYARQLLSAIGHLHAHGITHNDLKPSNILVAAEDGRPIVIDFGFATSWDLTSPDRFLSTLSWGTVEYLSPERARGQLHDERLSDIWALGVTLYELVVGRTPFEENEEESFLDRAQLDVYCQSPLSVSRSLEAADRVSELDGHPHQTDQRTLTGRFFGDVLISREFESLVRLMVEVDPHLRLQSCSKALEHRYFDPARPPPPPLRPLTSSRSREFWFRFDFRRQRNHS